jgi:hypothetical protein
MSNEPAPPPDPWPLQVASGVSICLGVAGMAASFHYLSLSDPRDIAAGNAGFIAGSILIGAGLISFALLFTRTR